MTHPYWTRLHVAEHEATHAVVARKLGLPVAWVSIVPGHDEGVDFGAAVKIPDDQLDMNDPACLAAVCVAMAAPSFMPNGNADIARYADIEADAAYQLGGLLGIEFDTIYDQAEELVWESHEEIHDLAYRLMDEGTVRFDAPSPDVQEADLGSAPRPDSERRDR